MKKICLILVVFVTLLVFFVCTIFAFETEKTLTLSAAELKGLRIDCGAGWLKVTGSPNADKIEVRARIHAEGRDTKDQNEFIADHVTLTLEKHGDRALLTSHIESHVSFFSFGDTGIDLEVTMPRNLGLDIDDGSGDLSVEDLAADVAIDDGSGGIHVSRIQGNLEIEDNSGEIEVRDVTGDVRIDDGSGSITVVGVGGQITVDDGSGGIDIDDVGRDVIIVDAGSGGVHIGNVKGRVIRRDEDD